MSPTPDPSDFSRMTVLLVGDAMVDAYYWGSVNRQSPEAPVPVLQVERSEHRLGGAANVALNLKSLGAEVMMCCTVGADEKGGIFRQLTEEAGMSTRGLVTLDGRPTTVKTRIIKGREHLLRIDEEVTDDLSPEQEDKFLLTAIRWAKEQRPDVILFQDYNKGILTPRVINILIDLAEEMNIPTVVDPKKKNFLAYRGVTLFKPNLKEIREGLHRSVSPTDPEDLRNAVEELRSLLNATAVLCTLSEHGAYLKTDREEFRLPAHPRNIVDVSGAGDTVVSVAALALAAGAGWKQVAGWSNLAGGLVCEEVGVVPIRPEQLKDALHELTN